MQSAAGSDVPAASPAGTSMVSRRQHVYTGIVGDSGVGKTSLMVKYVEGRFDTDYNETIGVQFLEKQLNAAGTLLHRQQHTNGQ